MPAEITIGITTKISKVIAIGDTSFGVDEFGKVYAWGEGYRKSCYIYNRR